jgi:hypothetical protein
MQANWNLKAIMIEEEGKQAGKFVSNAEEEKQASKFVSK